MTGVVLPSPKNLIRKLEKRKGRIVDSESKYEEAGKAPGKELERVRGGYSKNKSRKPSESNLTEAGGSSGPHGSHMNSITACCGKKIDKAETRRAAQHVGWLKSEF